MATHHDLVVGTFNTPALFTLRFIPPSPSAACSPKGSLKILKQHSAIGSHSWLHLSSPSSNRSSRNLYATAWTEPPTIASYAITSPTDISLLNTAATKTRSGYVCASDTHAYSAGGATGEVFLLDPDTGAFTSSSCSATTNGANGTHVSESLKSVAPLETLTFVSAEGQRDNGSTMDFGGLRHGAHSADLSRDGKLLYIADIGRNCIWMYSVSSPSSYPHLSLEEKKISPRRHDGPRHVHPHPNGKIVYCLQEHSSVVDVFEVAGRDDSRRNGESESNNVGVRLVHRQGVRIIPQGLDVSEFWADEVRTSLTEGGITPKFLYASTRGLKEGRKGFVAVYRLDSDGLIDGAEMVRDDGGKVITNGHGTSADNTKEWRDDDQGGLLCMYETATSGGWANAIQPGPTIDGVEYIAMTDSEVGYVFVLGWDGKEIREVARVDLNSGGGVGGKIRHGAATAVWF